jgi:hypothetical protein
MTRAAVLPPTAKPFYPVHWIASSVAPRPRRLCAGSQLLPGEIKLKMRSDYYAEAFILGMIQKRRIKVKTGSNSMSPQQLLMQVILSLSASSSRLTNVWGAGGQGWVLPPPPRSAHLGLNNKYTPACKWLEGLQGINHNRFNYGQQENRGVGFSR